MKALSYSENLHRLEKIRAEKAEKAIRSLPTLHLAKKLSVGLVVFSVGLGIWAFCEHLKDGSTLTGALTLPSFLLSLSLLSVTGCSQTIATIEALRSKKKPNQAPEPTALLGRGSP